MSNRAITFGLLIMQPCQGTLCEQHPVIPRQGMIRLRLSSTVHDGRVQEFHGSKNHRIGEGKLRVKNCLAVGFRAHRGKTGCRNARGTCASQYKRVHNGCTEACWCSRSVLRYQSRVPKRAPQRKTAAEKPRYASHLSSNTVARGPQGNNAVWLIRGGKTQFRSLVG